jgi:hypothetical protein
VTVIEKTYPGVAPTHPPEDDRRMSAGSLLSEAERLAYFRQSSKTQRGHVPPYRHPSHKPYRGHAL